MCRLVTEQLHIGYGNRTIVEDLNLHIPDGKITALVGANGSGKSTILKTMARIMKPEAGQVLLDGKSIQRRSTKEVATQLAILPQHPTAPDGLTVAELVSYGRFPHQRGIGSLSADDRKAIRWALEVTGMAEFDSRPVDQLSGGQRQRAWIAMSIAQDTEILFLDEPTTFLDMAHQLEVLHLLRRLNREEGRTIVMVVHDLNHAAQYAEHVVAIKQGRIAAEGAPESVITCDMLRDVFGVEAEIVTAPGTGLPVCLPFALAHEPYANAAVHPEPAGSKTAAAHERNASA
ncbi:ABC transporter ATP-binding protein [Paenibacillus beijingensis]|uniref:Iron-dicitrate transporter ATP-binding subunit n=1 Tax=Paenibacillus beijingensis TaxID=1126833 RepID=A0A0D5NGU9_9BACL|nr:ABC transporter ATP-binding protein [Paenibacillus beijingensis]AJY74365.1 iron-dicitrate transporter ATP-binding subunit [Paenibacillus beijingensis]